MKNRQKKILLVEDYESNRLCLRDFLELDGFICHEAENGAEEKMKVQSEPFDVVITDLTMPIMNGFQLIEALAENPFLERIPVLILTGLTFAEVKDKASHLSVADILPKPLVFS